MTFSLLFVTLAFLFVTFPFLSVTLSFLFVTFALLFVPFVESVHIMDLTERVESLTVHASDIAFFLLDHVGYI